MIYFLQREDIGLIKIGWSIDVLRRITQLKIKGTRLVLLGVCIGSHSYEQQLHRRFYGFHVEDEWFQPSEPILEFIRSNMVYWNATADWNLHYVITPALRFDRERINVRHNKAREHRHRFAAKLPRTPCSSDLKREAKLIAKKYHNGNLSEFIRVALQEKLDQIRREESRGTGNEYDPDNFHD